MAVDENPKKLSREWICESARYKYSYNFSWMGRTIIQYPQDMIAMQESADKSAPHFHSAKYPPLKTFANSPGSRRRRTGFKPVLLRMVENLCKFTRVPKA